MKTNRRSLLQTLLGFAGLTHIVKGEAYEALEVPDIVAEPRRDEQESLRRIRDKETQHHRIVECFDDQGRLLQRSVYDTGRLINDAEYKYL